MKKIILGLFAVLALSLSTTANVKSVKKVGHAFSVVKHHPPGHHRVGTYHRNLPRHASRVVINNRVYFRHGGTYFRPNRRGFVVVAPPRRAPRYYYNGTRYNNRNVYRAPVRRHQSVRQRGCRR